MKTQNFSSTPGPPNIVHYNIWSKRHPQAILDSKPSSGTAVPAPEDEGYQGPLGTASWHLVGTLSGPLWGCGKLC